MQKWLLALGIGMALAVVPAQAKQELKPWQKKALALVKKEKKVLDAFWRDPEHNVLFVSMRADGSRKDGFAEYLCMVLKDAGAPDSTLKSVFVYNSATFGLIKSKKGIGKKIGQAFCR